MYTREVAAFNLALPYLMRVNSILNSNYTEFRNGNTRAFAINLRQLYRELEPWLVQSPSKRVDEKTPILDMFEELAKIRKKNPELLWNKMEAIEIELRRNFKSLGMLMPKINDPRNLFGSKQK